MDGVQGYIGGLVHEAKRRFVADLGADDVVKFGIKATKQRTSFCFSGQRKRRVIKFGKKCLLLLLLLERGQRRRGRGLGKLSRRHDRWGQLCRCQCAGSTKRLQLEGSSSMICRLQG